MVVLQYGRKVDFKDKTMIVSVIGKGDKTIVLLPGLGSPSPVIEFKALSSFLCDKYKIITIEYLGYGVSDNPDTERNLDNITEEIHSCLESLNCKKYTLAAHSISGIYCLYYANKYPQEVENFIGIDTSVPYQIDNKELMETNLRVLETKRKKARSRLFRWKTRTMSKLMLTASGNDYQYSKQDMNTYSELMIYHLDNETAIAELKESNKNFGRLRDTHFPAGIPILFLLADRTIKIEPNWLSWHKKLLGNSKGNIIILHGMHYLHLIQPKRVAEEIDVFLSGE